MPIDTGLFQIVTLVLLLAGLVVGLIVLSSVGRIRRELSDRAQSERLYEAAPSPSPETGAAESEREQAATEEPAPAHRERAESRTAEQPGAVSATAGDAAAASEPEEAHAGTTTAAAVGGQQSQAASATTSADQASVEEPEQQPFERDGRWWFRRGSELLVYEEKTGEWVPAPTDERPPEAAPAATQSPADFARQQTQSETTQTGQDAGWKCPSCGAVNGSTAASCRMCFSPRA